MAANLGQAFLGGAGIAPALAQDLAARSFHESRESFHDYIYSKLILGDDKAGSPSSSNPNPPVFPNTNLANSYPTSLPMMNMYSISSSDSNLQVSESGVQGGHKPFSSSSAAKSGVSVQKLGNSSKKKSAAYMHQDVVEMDSFGRSDDLTKVKKKSHHKKKDKTNVCDVCQRGFAEKYTLNRHMLTHTHVKPYSCSKCNMSFSRSDGLAKHMAAGHRRIDAHHCDVCGGTFNSEVSFEQHRREYGNTLPFVCNLCMLAFSQCCHLNYHMKSHPLSKMNDSLLSDSQDNKNSAIDVSELIPDDFSPPKKEQSKNSFTFLTSPSKAGDRHGFKAGDHSHSALDPSIVIKPEIEDFPTCRSAIMQASRVVSEEGASLATSSSFDALNNFPSVTSQSSSFQPQKDLQSTPSYLPDTLGSLHQSSSGESVPISDSEIKKYLDIKIPNPKFLETPSAHNSSLSDDGLFRCELCSKGFTRKYHMQRHVKLHIRGPVPKAHLLDWTRRPYACGVCKMGFTRQHHLTRHMLIHTGERPHSCHVCGKAFRRYTNLTLHVRTVHGAERPFKCHICTRGFPRLYSLQRHLKLHAKNAARLSMLEAGQLDSEFKAVGTVILDGGKSSYNSLDPASIQESPGHSQDSMSSDHSDESDEFDDESHLDGSHLEHIDPDRSDSPGQERYTHLQNESHENTYQRQNDHNSQGQDQTPSSYSGQDADRLDHAGLRLHQVLPSTDSDNRIIRNRIASDNDNVIQQYPAQISANINQPPRPTGEPLGNQSHVLSRNATEFNQQPIQSTNSDGFISSTLSAHNLQSMDVPTGKGFSELDVREGRSFSLCQRNGSDFNMQQQRIQSPQMTMGSLERPGSRGVMSQAGSADAYRSSPGIGYIQSPSSLISQQQRGGIDVSVSRATMSPAEMQDTAGVYSHSHTSSSLNNVAEAPVYSHNRGVPYPTGAHGMYQQQLSDNLDPSMHPNPSASPMPISSHSNNMYAQ